MEINDAKNAISSLLCTDPKNPSVFTMIADYLKAHHETYRTAKQVIVITRDKNSISKGPKVSN